MTIVKNLLGKNVKKYRTLAGMGQTDLARKVGVQSQHISNIEAGRAFASADLVARLAAALDVSAEELFYAGPDAALLPGKLAALRREIRRTFWEAKERICGTL